MTILASHCQFSFALKFPPNNFINLSIEGIAVDTPNKLLYLPLISICKHQSLAKLVNYINIFFFPWCSQRMNQVEISSFHNLDSKKLNGHLYPCEKFTHINKNQVFTKSPLNFLLSGENVLIICRVIGPNVAQQHHSNGPSKLLTTQHKSIHNECFKETFSQNFKDRI